MTAVVKQRRVHPVADLFPMLVGEDLASLAADIGERGLLHPVVLDSEGRVLDGRNRLAACEIAHVEPAFVTYDGNDPDGYALAVNIARRNLTKGQTAMVAAKALNLNAHGAKAEAGRTMGINRAQIASAQTILDFAPDLVDSVISGATPLDSAYGTARDRKRASQDTDAAMNELRRQHPELADLVANGDLTLTEALKTGRERVKAERQHEVDQANRLGANVLSGMELQHPDIRENYVRYWRERRDEVSGPRREFMTIANLRANGEAYLALADLFEKEGLG